MSGQGRACQSQSGSSRDDDSRVRRQRLAALTPYDATRAGSHTTRECIPQRPQRHACIPWPDGRTTNVAVFARAELFILTSVSALIIGSCQRKLSPHQPWLVRRVRQLMRKLVRLSSPERRRRVVGRAPFTHDLAGCALWRTARRWRADERSGRDVPAHASCPHVQRHLAALLRPLHSMHALRILICSKGCG